MADNTENQDQSAEGQENKPAFTVRVSNDDDDISTFGQIQNQEQSQENNNTEGQNSESDENSDEQNQENSENQNDGQEQGQQQAEVQYEDSKVLEYIKGKLGIEISDFDQLKPKEQKQLTPEIEAFLQFKEETNNDSYSDFLETQKDWSSENPEVVIKKQMALDYPMLTKEQIDFRFNKKFGTDNLDPEDDADEIQERTIEKTVELQRAIKSLDAQKEKYKVNRGTDALIPDEYKTAKATIDQLKQQQEEHTKIATQQRNEFVSATEKTFSKDFEGFKVKVDGQDLVIKPSDLQKTKNDQLDIANFQKKYFDNNGNPTDINGYHAALFFGMNQELVASHFYNLGKAAFAEQEERNSKNISNGNLRNIAPTRMEGMVIKKVAE